MPTKLRTETRKIEAMIRYTQPLDKRDKSSEEELRQLLEDAQAEGVSTFDSLRTRTMLKITNDNAALVGMWLREREFGDFSDNYEALAVSLRRVERGEVTRGLVVLCMLRAHIVRSTEIKSSRYILPVIDKTLNDIDVAALESAGDVAGRPESEALE